MLRVNISINSILIFITIQIFAHSLPERVWEVQTASPDLASSSSSSSKERILRSPHVANNRPQKIRLINYEQRHLAARQQKFEESNININAKNISYLEMVRQKMRGVPSNVVVQQAIIPLTSIESKPIDSRLPELDSLHKARQLFETREDGSTLAPLSELEIKEDYQLQKSMQRTTLQTKIYPTDNAIDDETNNSEPSIFSYSTTPLPSPSMVSKTMTPTLVQPSFGGGGGVSGMPQFQPFPTFPNLTQPSGFINPLELPSFPQPPQPPPVASFPNAPGGGNLTTLLSTSPKPPQFEQLGCGFDFILNSCKDVFTIGWCDSCEDFGNIFLHDCRCTQPSQRYQLLNSTMIPEVRPMPPLQQQSQGLPPLSPPPPQQQQQQLFQAPTMLQQPTTPELQNRTVGFQNFFIQPRFFGFFN